jgi:hypothetical protein
VSCRVPNDQFIGNVLATRLSACFSSISFLPFLFFYLFVHLYRVCLCVYYLLSYFLLYFINSLLACNETNLMHYLSSVYSVTIPLHVSGFLAAHHQWVTMYICNNWYVLYVLVDCQLASGASILFHYTHISRRTVNKT